MNWLVSDRVWRLCSQGQVEEEVWTLSKLHSSVTDDSDYLTFFFIHLCDIYRYIFPTLLFVAVNTRLKHMIQTL